MATKEYNATVTERIDIASGLMILRVKPDAPSTGFSPGQYTVLGLRGSAPRVPNATPEETVPGDKMILRAYSIASSSKMEDYFEFYVTLVNSGELTPRLFALQKDDRLFIGPKSTGMFTIDRIPKDANVLLVATGTGLAPYMSMLRTHLYEQENSAHVVLHGARTSLDLGYRQELTAWSQKRKNFIYVPCISIPEEDPTWKGRTGFLQDLLASQIVETSTGLALKPTNFHAFLCGNPLMIEAVKKLLMGKEFTPDQKKLTGTLHLEEYW